VKRRESTTSGTEHIEDEISTGDWVAAQLCLSLQLLASQAQDQVHHFPPNVAIISELCADYEHFAECISTYWELSHGQALHLKTLQSFFEELDRPERSDFWTEEALFSDPRWNRIRHLANQALLSFHWPLEAPPPEPGSLGWNQLNG
jgi:hypothetical protein